MYVLGSKATNIWNHCLRKHFVSSIFTMTAFEICEHSSVCQWVNTWAMAFLHMLKALDQGFLSGFLYNNLGFLSLNSVKAWMRFSLTLNYWSQLKMKPKCKDPFMAMFVSPLNLTPFSPTIFFQQCNPVGETQAPLVASHSLGCLKTVHILKACKVHWSHVDPWQYWHCLWIMDGSLLQQVP